MKRPILLKDWSGLLERNKHVRIAQRVVETKQLELANAMLDVNRAQDELRDFLDQELHLGPGEKVLLEEGVIEYPDKPVEESGSLNGNLRT